MGGQHILPQAGLGTMTPVTAKGRVICKLRRRKICPFWPKSGTPCLICHREQLLALLLANQTDRKLQPVLVCENHIVKLKDLKIKPIAKGNSRRSKGKKLRGFILSKKTDIDAGVQETLMLVLCRVFLSLILILGRQVDSNRPKTKSKENKIEMYTQKDINE